MRLLAFQLALLTWLLTWRLRRRGHGRRVTRIVWLVGGAISILALPHTLFGWQVRQHVPAAFLAVQMPLAAAWFFLGLVVGLGLWFWDALFARIPAPVDPSRRKLLAQAPLALAAAVPLGVAGAEREPPLRSVRIPCPALPPAFEGFRILQISDLHLGPTLGLDWLSRALDRAARSQVDLVAITGDLSDDLALMSPALARIAQVPARFGHVAIPGNHEHYVGIPEFEAAVRASPVKLLTGQALPLQLGGETLQLLGIDYPFAREKDKVQFARMLDAVLAKAGPGFRLLLSHHPDAFDEAAPRGIQVTLSGHTHGGQIALFGKTPLSIWLKYPRGLFQQGDARLWVTTGLGHWFPYRVDCPTELPLIELVRG